MTRWILASASPRRQELLRNLGHEFEVIVSHGEENAKLPEGFKIEDEPAFFAKAKAREVASLVKTQQTGDAASENILVIGADTLVMLDGKALGKPQDQDDARYMLRLLSGRTHEVVTGCCLILNGKEHTFEEHTKVTFYDLTEEEISSYINSGEPMDKAGAYGIQGLGCLLVRGIEGDFFNVVGLPVARLYREIQAFEAGIPAGEEDLNEDKE